MPAHGRGGRGKDLRRGGDGLDQGPGGESGPFEASVKEKVSEGRAEEKRVGGKEGTVKEGMEFISRRGEGMRDRHT